jgi:hypothetical protein
MNLKEEGWKMNEEKNESKKPSADEATKQEEALTYDDFFGPMIRRAEAEKRQRLVAYGVVKDTLNKLHDKLYSADDTLKKRFIDNPDKKELLYKDLLMILSSLSELEAQIVVAKDTIVQELILQNFFK